MKVPEIIHRRYTKFMEINEGKLVLCATPIGNLEDITFRVIEALKDADLIAAEDTRNSLKLLNHFDIKKPMTSYHEHNKYEKAEQLLSEMKKGKVIALITDAGTPAISDPGEILVRRCNEEGVKVTSLPGPAACITALTLSGLSTRRFCFEGFLPADKKEKQEVLDNLKGEIRTTVLYEAPHRLKKTLKELLDNLGDRKISICRELTKIHEEVICSTLSEAIEIFNEREPKGEFVLVIEGKSLEELREEEKEIFQNMSLEEHLKMYEDKGLDNKSAMKMVAKDLGISKRDVYQMLINRKEEK